MPSLKRVVRLNSNSALKSKTGHLNRLVHLEPDADRAVDDLVHRGAMNYLHSIRAELQTHDFIVVDVILKEAAQRELARLLLSSTIWFDATNGAAFAAFSDESLVFPTVKTLVQVRAFLQLRMLFSSFLFKQIHLFVYLNVVFSVLSKWLWLCPVTSDRCL